MNAPAGINNSGFKGIILSTHTNIQTTIMGSILKLLQIHSIGGFATQTNQSVSGSISILANLLRATFILRQLKIKYSGHKNDKRYDQLRTN